MTRNFIPDSRQSRSNVIYKALRVISSSKEEELTKKYISNRIKYPQHDLKQDEAIRQINLAVDDKILSLNGVNYHFGKFSFENSDHDWYCYKCHESKCIRNSLCNLIFFNILYISKIDNFIFILFHFKVAVSLNVPVAGVSII